MATIDAVLKRYGQRKYAQWNSEPWAQGFARYERDYRRGLAFQDLAGEGNEFEYGSEGSARYHAYLLRVLADRREDRDAARIGVFHINGVAYG